MYAGRCILVWMACMGFVWGCDDENTGIDGTGGMGSGGESAGGTGGQLVAINPLDGAGEVESVQSGFMFTEGPVWRASEGVLLFSDIPAAKIYRLQANGSIDTFRDDSGKSNGLIYDENALLLAAEHQNRRVSRTLANGNIVEVVSEFEGNKLNSPNDLAVRDDGTIYFTDPPYGLDGRPREVNFNGVFRLDTSGGLTAEWQGDLDSRPNGLVLSPDQSRLYVADTVANVMVFEVSQDGSLSEPADFATDVQNGDGMAIDGAGNLYVTAADGVRVYSPQGSLWGVIEVPEQPANCTFGGSNGKTLFVTARTSLYRVELPSAS